MQPKERFILAHMKLETDAKGVVVLSSPELTASLKFASDGDKNRFVSQMNAHLEELNRKNKGTENYVTLF